MPDISMCDGAGCERKELCYRYTATPSYMQSYFSVAPVDEKGTCKWYWQNDETGRNNCEQVD